MQTRTAREIQRRLSSITRMPCRNVMGVPSQGSQAARGAATALAVAEETSTKFAPWYLIPANDKPFGRIAAFRVIADRLGKGVSLKPRPINPQLFKQARRILGVSAADIRRAAKKADRKMSSKHVSR